MKAPVILLSFLIVTASCTVGKNSLRIKTNPSNAEVYINGKFIRLEHPTVKMEMKKI
ncbi:MAG TPA: PEGA domain-containing protein [Chitinophagaceae bacterium]|nr:PEGA domain-containing protein [Chitinophagaceae bacterium]